MFSPKLKCVYKSNVNELTQQEQRNINGGAWWIVVAACITAVNELGDIAYNIGNDIGESMVKNQ
ncbi:hypothetical protein LB456_06690 [Psychroflexus sp. CAK57W]|uniref:hypothetical protein n=1 Tax=Psychroflexus curvus TaxID=2873595 RepID=UPI001CCBAAF0|nr:hypothetical protein [Psychroflexus curvus]MBZ9787144.1 hypothetical protein [Psychroflexus curvus]